MLRTARARAEALQLLADGDAFAQTVAVGAAVELCLDLSAEALRLPQGIDPGALRGLRRAIRAGGELRRVAAERLLFEYVPADEGHAFRSAVVRLAELGAECSARFDDDVLYAMGEHAEAAADDFLQGAEWMYQKAALLNQPEEARCGAATFLRLCALVLGAEPLIRRALQSEDEHARETALFYCDTLLPHAKALSLACTRGVRRVLSAEARERAA